jgi:hypothetical protein
MEAPGGPTEKTTHIRTAQTAPLYEMARHRPRYTHHAALKTHILTGCRRQHLLRHCWKATAAEAEAAANAAAAAAHHIFAAQIPPLAQSHTGLHPSTRAIIASSSNRLGSANWFRAAPNATRAAPRG